MQIFFKVVFIIILICIIFIIWKNRVNVLKILLSHLKNLLNIQEKSKIHKFINESLFIQIISKVILTSVLFYIGLIIWQYEIDVEDTLLTNIKKFVSLERPVQEPNLHYELNHSWGKYQEGLKVYGIEWKDNYMLYDFIFRNKSRDLNVEGIRLTFEFPVIFVACKEIEREGMGGISISNPEAYIRKGKGKTIVDMIKLRTNAFTININKAYPHSFIHFKIFLKELEQKSQQNKKLPAYFTIKYHFAGKNEKELGKRIIHPINVGEKLSDYSIDTSKTFTLQELKEGTPHVRIVEPIKPVTIEGKRD